MAEQKTRDPGAPRSTAWFGLDRDGLVARFEPGAPAVIPKAANTEVAALDAQLAAAGKAASHPG